LPGRHIGHSVALLAYSPDMDGDFAEQTGLPDFRQAPRPTRVYSGRRNEGANRVSVRDSSHPEAGPVERDLTPEASREIHDYSAQFDWGAETAGALQLSVALLLDVTGDPGVARRWCQLFAHKYVANLPQEWTVPEIDIDLWLYCFENERPGA